MNKHLIFLFVTIFFSLLAFHSCSRPLADDQLHFGIEAAQKDLWDEAIFRWKKVIEITPGSAAAHNNLAVAYEKKGFWEEAKKEYEIALKLSPEDTHIKSNYQNFKNHYEHKENEEI
jgi:Tfp pilus assembly protein PilF